MDIIQALKLHLSHEETRNALRSQVPWNDDKCKIVLAQRVACCLQITRFRTILDTWYENTETSGKKLELPRTSWKPAGDEPRESYLSLERGHQDQTG